jgi:hypothetical protein
MSGFPLCQRRPLRLNIDMANDAEEALICLVLEVQNRIMECKCLRKSLCY